MEAMGTTYCEEEHHRTIRKISNKDGYIEQEAFVQWYLDWLFGDDEDSQFSDESNDDGKIASGKADNDQDEESGTGEI